MDVCGFIFKLFRVFAVYFLLGHFKSYVFTVSAAPVESEIEAMMYLQNFGYMKESSSNSASLISEKALSSAIEGFQKFAGIAETGVLDDTTLKMMNTPRCGDKDDSEYSESARRRKRFALKGGKWDEREITYRISKYSHQIRDKEIIDKEIARAFKVWSDVAKIKFINRAKGPVNIDIQFVTDDHGDGNEFDGPGNTLAHAFYPEDGGDAHFDDEENWTINKRRGTNLLQVAAHEFGHSLGLSHSRVKESLMTPFFRGYKPSCILHEDDIHGIQALYGPPARHSGFPECLKPKSKSKKSSSAPNLCKDSAIDAATKTEDGSKYVFKGKYYWKIAKAGIAKGYPKKISDDWSGLPGNLDAALTWKDGKTFLFKGNQFWKFINKEMESGYPQNISVGFPGIPDKIDAAFVWSGNGKTYFLKGHGYWIFDSKSNPQVTKSYPKPISSWKGLPNNIDAAVQWSDETTYFFKGRKFFKINDDTRTVDKADPPYPRSTSIWLFGCK